MQAPGQEGQEKLRATAARLRGTLGEIRAWRDIPGNAPPAPRSDDDNNIDEELLDACEQIVAALNDLSPNALESLLRELPLQAVAAHLRDAQFRTIRAGFTRIDNSANKFRDQVGHDLLQRAFPEYGVFFALLAEAVLKAECAKIPEKIDEFLRWAAARRETLDGLYRRMLACQSAALDAKRRERKKFQLAALACALTALGALIALAFN